MKIRGLPNSCSKGSTRRQCNDVVVYLALLRMCTINEDEHTHTNLLLANICFCVGGGGGFFRSFSLCRDILDFLGETYAEMGVLDS